MLFDPTSPEFLADPHITFARLRESDPVHWYAPGGCWIITRYADVKCVLTDPRFGHERLGGGPSTGAAQLDPRYAALARMEQRQQALWLAMRSFPGHARLRVLLTPFFTQEAVDQLRPYIQAQADQLLDGVLPAGEMDLVGDFADHLPFDVACEVVGVPNVDRTEVKPWLRDTVSGMGLHPAPTVRLEGTIASVKLASYFRRLVSARREQPKSDLISALSSEPSLDEEEAAAYGVRLLITGEVNPRAMIANGVLSLLRQPEKMRWLRRHPEALEPALEELLRYDNAAQLTARRVALEDVELDGRCIRRGQSVLAFTGAANRDSARFENPDCLDLKRTPNPHLSFGAGINGCLGPHLARAELQISLCTLLRRVPDLALRGEPTDWIAGFFPHGPQALPVRF